MLRAAAPLLAILLLLAPTALAGTPEAPELTDPAGDTMYAYGSEYGNVVSAWISDETATDFRVNLALAKVNEPLANAVGYAVQFEHQGVEFGVVASYFNGAWEFGNGRVNAQTGNVDDYNSSEGTFTAGTPAVLTIQFLKGNFPHQDAADNQLRSFFAGSADFKSEAPFFVAPRPDGAPPTFVLMDVAESDGTYTFQAGEHSAHGGEDTSGGQTPIDAPQAEDNRTANAGEPMAPVQEKETPPAGLAAALAATGLAAWMSRRRRA